MSFLRYEREKGLRAATVSPLRKYILVSARTGQLLADGQIARNFHGSILLIDFDRF